MNSLAAVPRGGDVNIAMWMDSGGQEEDVEDVE
jgi:hypothetical protein